MGHIYHFDNGFQFIKNPAYPSFLWTTTGYLDTPDARKLFRKMLDQGHTFRDFPVKLFGFDMAEDHSEYSEVLGWRDMDSASK